MSTETHDAASASTEQLADRFRDVPWVVRVAETKRNEATHQIITEKSLVRMNDEIHTIENLGCSVQAISQTGHYGCRVYVAASFERSSFRASS